MKKRLSAFLYFILLSSQGLQSQINISIGYEEKQKISGFGAAIADWLYDHNNNSTYIDQVVNDLGLSMMRLMLSPGFEPVNDNSNSQLAGTFNTGGTVATQLAVIDKLQQRGLRRVALSLFSPPAWMKTNASEIGGELRTDMYEEFAEFYIEYIRLIESHGLTVYAISPENEPRWAQSYASCVYDAEQLRDIIIVLGKRLEKEGMKIRIFGPEDITASPWKDYTELICNDTTARKYMNIAALHHQIDINTGNIATWSSVYQGHRNYLSSFNTDLNALEFWNSELSGFPNGWDGAFNLSLAYMMSLRDGKMNALLFGSPSIPSSANQDKEALMVDRVATARYYVAKQFYRYIRPGAVMVNCTDDVVNGIYAIAFKHGEESRLTIIAINTSGSNKTINLVMDNKPNDFSYYRTTSSENCSFINTVNGNNISLPPQSVNTFVAEGTNHLPTIESVKNIALLMNSAASFDMPIKGISDGDGFTQNLTITAISSNSSLIPNPVIKYTQGSSTGTVTFSPLSGKTGTAVITLTLQDNGESLNNGFLSTKKITFVVTVIPFINHAPLVNTMNDYVCGMNNSTKKHYIYFSGLSDGDNGSQTISKPLVTLSDPTIVRLPYVNYNSPNTSGNIEFYPNKIGQTTVTFTFQDNGGSELGGKDTKQLSFKLTVTDDAPYLDAEELRTPVLSVYPNPADDKISVSIPSELRQGSLSVKNIEGKTVLEQKLSDSENIDINVTGLPSGTYILYVHKDGIIAKKIFVKR